MSILIKNVKVNGQQCDIAIKGNRIDKIAKDIKGDYDEVIDGAKLTALPAFIDMHTHLREPGFEYKEDIESGSKAAVAGGYSVVCCMPNTKPATDNKYIVKYIVDRAKEVNLAKVYPIGAITVGLKGELMAEMGKMKEAGAIAMSDDGQPVSSAQMMRLALEYAKDYDMLLCSHCEEKSLINEGVVNEGENATRAGLKGIPSAAEDIMISRDVILAEMLDTKVHICHVSTASGVQIIREAKARGVSVTAETCPHYFTLTDDVVVTFDANTKVNPPVREAEDVAAIKAGLADGTLDCIITDHAPHTAEEKAREVPKAPSGMVGLETSLALSLTVLHHQLGLPLSFVIEKMSTAPAKILQWNAGTLAQGAPADIVLFDPDEEWTVEPERFASKGRNTPFAGWNLKGRVHRTLVDGKTVYDLEEELRQG